METSMVKLGVEGSLWLPVAGHGGVAEGHFCRGPWMFVTVTMKVMKDVAVSGSISDDD